jgi:hypothetical protein
MTSSIEMSLIHFIMTIFEITRVILINLQKIVYKKGIILNTVIIDN